MSYKTVEVHLENGRVSAVGSETLPARADGLLTILASEPTPTSEPARRSLAELVGHLAGIGRGEQTDLSSNKSHLDDFGR